MLRIFLISCFFLLSTCTGDHFKNQSRQNSNGEPEVVTIVENDEGKKVVEYEEDEEDERRTERERERLRNRIIVSTVDDRFGGVGKDYKSYDSDKCGEYESCKDICDKTTRAKKACYRQPRDLIEDVQNGLFDLINISDVDDVGMHAGLLQGILEFDKKLILKLVDDHMSEGDLKSFLVWIAVNKSIADVLEREDRRAQILALALKELGRYQSGSRKYEETGLSTGLIRRDDTFLFLASDENNTAAFQMGYDVLQSTCGNREDCKLKLLCARERRRVSRAKSLGLALGCRTPENSRQRSIRDRICYVHGSSVWSFLYELIEDKDIRDSDFRIDEDDSEEGPIGVTQCNKLCGSKSSDTCSTTF